MDREKPLSLQPIPYQGSKRKLAPSIATFLPDRVETLYEPFAGSAAVTLFAAQHELADNFVIGEKYAPLAELWRLIVGTPEEISHRYFELWERQFIVGREHFNQVRSEYNSDHDPAKLLYLIARCVKNAVRFNRAGRFTQSVDKRRTGMKPERFRRAATYASKLLKGRARVFSGSFEDCCVGATENDLIYMDPPYQGTTYGKDRRYASGLGREPLVDFITSLDLAGVSYILSYDGMHGEKSYGEPLPDTLRCVRHLLNAGLSSQATLNGKRAVTIESLYVSETLPQTRLYREKLDKAA